MSIEYEPAAPLVLFAINNLQSAAERYRLAWTSARGRAASLLDERDALRAELAQMSKAYAEACQSLQVLRGDTP